MWAYGVTKKSVDEVSKIKLEDRIPSMGVRKLDVPVPKLNDDEVLIKVKASALNFNSIWSSLSHPISSFQLINQHVQRNPIDKSHIQSFAIFGSDASGIIEKVGKSVSRWKIGDEVVVHCNIIDTNDPISQADGMLPDSQSIWGYETNYGAFAEYTKVKSSQLIKKPKTISWEDAASFSLTHSTAYRMLISKNGAQIKAGETCLIWGAAGGLGVFAIQLAKLSGANVVAVVSDNEKIKLCKSLGADVVINRKTDLPISYTDDNNNPDYLAWRKVKIALKKKGVSSIDVVFEHVGKETLGLSTFLLNRGGRIVTCAATSGYLATIDLRFLWMQLKSIIGSHFANYDEATKAAELIFSRKIKPIIHSINEIKELPKRMDEMYTGKTFGKIVFKHS